VVSGFKISWLLSYLSIASMSAAIITPALPAIESQYNLGQGEVEWMVSIFLLGYVIGQLIYGPLANRWGRVSALRTGLVINILGIGLCILAVAIHLYWLLLLGRLISALGAASGLACTYMIINEWLPETQKKSAMAYSIISFTLGIGLAVTIGGLITEYWVWSGCFLILLIHGIIVLIGTAVFPETLIKPQSMNIKSIIQGYKLALSSPTLVIFALAIGFCSVVGYCFSAAAPQIAIERLHLSAADYGYWNLLNMIGMLAGGLSAKFLLGRLQPLHVVAIGLVLSATGILSLFLMLEVNSTSALWFFISSMSLYLFSSLIFSGASFIASSAVLTDKASGSAMMSFINMFSAMLAVTLMGYLSTNMLTAFVSILVISWLLIGALLTLRQINS